MFSKSPLFFILGLPRSRTAWLSAFISQSGVFCHHEAINGCSSMVEYKNKVGNCGDSTTGFSYLDIKQNFPNTKILVIKKNQMEFNRACEWSFNALGYNLRDELALMDEELSAFDAMVINQDTISHNLKQIWQYLVDVKWHDKYALIDNLNIQMDVDCLDADKMVTFNATI